MFISDPILISAPFLLSAPISTSDHIPLKMTMKIFSGSNPPVQRLLRIFLEPLTLPPRKRNFQNPIHQDGGIFLDDPFLFGHMDSERSVEC